MQIERTRLKLDAAYGINPAPTEGMLDWQWVVNQATKARNYWVCSTRPDSRPHAAPVWAIWVEDVLYFSTSANSRKGKNLGANPAVVIHMESGDEVVIIEGEVESITDVAKLKELAIVYAAKYDIELFEEGSPSSLDQPSNLLYAVRPQIVLAWLESDFTNSAARFVCTW